MSNFLEGMGRVVKETATDGFRRVKFDRPLLIFAEMSNSCRSFFLVINVLCRANRR